MVYVYVVQNACAYPLSDGRFNYFQIGLPKTGYYTRNGKPVMALLLYYIDIAYSLIVSDISVIWKCFGYG